MSDWLVAQVGCAALLAKDSSMCTHHGLHVFSRGNLIPFRVDYARSLRTPHDDLDVLLAEGGVGILESKTSVSADCFRVLGRATATSAVKFNREATNHVQSDTEYC